MKLNLLVIFLATLCFNVWAQDEDPFENYDPDCSTLFDSVQSSMFYQRFTSKYGIKDGETVADIGAASGWKTILQILQKNSKNTFYLEDIDTACLNQKNFNKVIKWYSALSSAPVDDTFHFIIGDEKSTHLPKNTFDRVILDLTYHELTYKQKMLADINSILKEKGVLIIAENIALKPGKRRKDCGHEMPVEKELVNELMQNGFKLKTEIENTYIPKKAFLF